MSAISVSNHRRLDCLNRRFRCKSKTTSKFRVTGLCDGNPPHKGPVTRKMFPFLDVIMLQVLSMQVHYYNLTWTSGINYNKTHFDQLWIVVSTHACDMDSERYWILRMYNVLNSLLFVIFFLHSRTRRMHRSVAPTMRRYPATHIPNLNTLVCPVMERLLGCH